MKSFRMGRLVWNISAVSSPVTHGGTGEESYFSPAPPRVRAWRRLTLTWFSNRTGTSVDDGKARGKDLTRLPVPNLPLCHWSSQLFDAAKEPIKWAPFWWDYGKTCFEWNPQRLLGSVGLIINSTRFQGRPPNKRLLWLGLPQPAL